MLDPLGSKEIKMYKCTGKYTFESVKDIKLSIMKGWALMQTPSHGPFWT